MRPPFRRSLISFALVCFLACAAPVRAETKVVQVNASVLKPLTLEWVQDLDLGTIATGPGSWSGATVSISRTGVFSCTNANLTCSGATQVAKYRVAGSNRETVQISAPNVTLVNQGDPSQTLVLVVDSPGTLTLPNSGVPGIEFSLGGAITLSSATGGGVYRGTFDVTVDY